MTVSCFIIRELERSVEVCLEPDASDASIFVPFSVIESIHKRGKNEHGLTIARINLADWFYEKHIQIT